MLLQFDPADEAAAVRDEHRAWARRYADPLAGQIRPHANDRTAGRRLRVGYVSPDFREHVVTRSLLPVLEHHDRERFEVVCYSDGPAPDDQTRRVRASADVWRETSKLSDPGLTELIRRDRVDILIDLALHMGRPLVFARRPAPVQMTYLGYPAETGLSTIDYRITDVFMDPPPNPTTATGTEQPLRLPHCYWVYRAPAAIEVGPLPASRRGGAVTFGSFNDRRRIHAGVIAAWARILHALPDARLLMVVRRGGEDDTLVREMFQAHGVAADRLRLLPRQPLEAYLRLHHEVDVSLDPFPYNGGITSLDSLWMGVPFVTLRGRRAVGRTGLSLLSNVNLGELVACDVDQYVQIAVELARHSDRLTELRGSLRGRLERSPLMDERLFTRDLELLLVQAWERWRTTPG